MILYPRQRGVCGRLIRGLIWGHGEIDGRYRVGDVLDIREYKSYMIFLIDIGVFLG